MMLQEDRFAKVLAYLEEHGSATTQELCKSLKVSESTVRRDVTEMDRLQLLKKVFGGATTLRHDAYISRDDSMESKVFVHRESKIAIGKKAASLIVDGDHVYLDSGTTVGAMLPFVKAKDVSFVTSSLSSGKTLSEMGYTVTILEGVIKAITDSIIGAQAIASLQKYHFTKGFFGTNGLSPDSGFTTPDTNEAILKQTGMSRCRDVYVLADYSKFEKYSSVRFTPLNDFTVITDKEDIGDEYGDWVFIQV